MRLMHMGLLMAVPTWHCVTLVVALISNRTIDDTYGDPVTGQKILFLPTTQGVWKNQDCVGCSLNPNTVNAFQGTYTAATYNPGLGSISATLKFQGTAVYVFFILANSASPGITTVTAVNFTLDDQPPVAKLHTPSVLTSDFEYNSMLWSQAGLSATQHTLVVSTSGVDNDVYVNFDYAIYTHDDDEIVVPTTSSLLSPTSAAMTVLSPVPTTLITTTVFSSSSSASPNTSEVLRGHRGVIAGGITAGAFLVLALVFSLLYLCRRHRKYRQLLAARPVVFNPQGGPEIFRRLSSITPFANYSLVHSAAPFPKSGEAFLSDKSGHAERPIKESSPPLSYAGTNTSAVMINPHSEVLRRVRQEELNHQLTTWQEAIRELSSNLDDNTDNRDLANHQQYTRRVSVKTLQRLRSLAGRDAIQQESSDSSHLADTRDFDTRGVNGETEVNVTELQELNRHLRLEIESLKLQQQSAWAQGISDDPPPGYTPPMRSYQEA